MEGARIRVRVKTEGMLRLLGGCIYYTIDNDIVGGPVMI